MKRLLFIVAIMLPMFAFAQGNKRVAILETVDKYDKVEYGVEFQLRAFITDAVNKTPGYEGFDRVDMSQINKEHNFQRTGMVSDADIKKLGEMTGANSIVVAEAAAYGDGRIIIAAKIINIESGRIENSTKPKVASTSGNEMENACNDIVADLLGKKGNSSNSNIVSAQGYIDLGLPSGTLWKATNESGYYDYENAVNKYGTSLPTKEQLEELKDYCTWKWTENGYKVSGVNGNFIVLPAAGYQNCGGNENGLWVSGDYWSSTPKGRVTVWYLVFNSDRVGMLYGSSCFGRSVRLVKKP